jgi:hypothetical protein
MYVCEPCRDDHHMECDGTLTKHCYCLICEGERIGDQVMGETGGNFPRRKR